MRLRLPDQPVAQPQRGIAVVLVVVGDALQQRACLVLPAVVAVIAVVGVRDHRCGGVGDVAVARLLRHVQRFELLDAVGPFADAQAPAHHRIQIDEDVVAQQGVDSLLADAVPSRQPQQRRLLVRGVVVDVHVRVLLTTRGHVVEEVDECLPLLGAVVCPERPERGGVGGTLDHAEEVFETPVRGSVLGPERVSLEVEEDVAVVRFRQPAQRLRGVHLELGVPEDSWRNCRAACARSDSRVRSGRPSTLPVCAARASRVPIPAAISRLRCVVRIPATSRRSQCCSTSGVHVSHRPHAVYRGSPHSARDCSSRCSSRIRSSEERRAEYTGTMSPSECAESLSSPSSRWTSGEVGIPLSASASAYAASWSRPTPSRAGTVWCRRRHTCRRRGRGNRRNPGSGRRRTSPGTRRRRRRGSPPRWPGSPRTVPPRCTRDGPS